MTYTAKTKNQLRGESGSLLKKLGTEFGLIDTEIDKFKEEFLTIGPLLATGATTFRIDFPFAVTIDNAILFTTVVIDASSNFWLKNAAGTGMTDGSANAYGAVATRQTITPTANNTIAADASMNIVCDGVATTGEVLIQLAYTRNTD